MIDLKNLSRLRNGEFIQLIDNLLTIVKDRQASSLNIQNQFNVLDSRFNLLTDSYTVIRKNDLSKTLADIDQKRDDLYLGLKSLIDSHAKYNPSDHIKDKAQSIFNILESYGARLIKMPYPEETAALKNIIEQLQDKQLENHINNTFHGDMYYNALITTNDRFDRLYVDRIKDYGAQDKENIKELRTEVEEALNEMVQRINAYIILEPSEHFIGAANEINAALDLYFNNLKKRSSSEPNEEQEEATA